MERDKMSPPIQETNKETNKETNLCSSTQSKSSTVVETNKELIENNTNLILDSKNKRDKVAKWDKERLIKAMEIYNKQEGIYFTLLEKIYKDDRNFTKQNIDKATPKSNTVNATVQVHKEDAMSLEEKIVRKMKKREQEQKDYIADAVKDEITQESIVKTNSVGYTDDVLERIKKINSLKNGNQ